MSSSVGGIAINNGKKMDRHFIGRIIVGILLIEGGIWVLSAMLATGEGTEWWEFGVAVLAIQELLY